MNHSEKRNFLDTYLAGETCLAARSGKGQTPAEQHFADALVFGTLTELESAIGWLMRRSEFDYSLLDHDRYLINLLGFNDQAFGHILEQHLLPPQRWVRALLSYREETIWTQAEIQRASEELLPMSRADFLLRVNHFQSNLKLKKRFPKLLQGLHNPILNPSLCSFLPYHRPGQITFDLPVEVPVLFMEPYAIDWKTALEPLVDRPAIFVFPDSLTLSHCVSLEGVLEALEDRKHLLFVSDGYANFQLAAQPNRREIQGKLEPVRVGTRELIWDNADQIVQGLTECLAQDRMRLRQDSECADQLYRLGRAIGENVRFERLGKECRFALQANLDTKKWYDPHKRSHGVEVGLRQEFIQEALEELNEPIRRASNRERPLRIAHITPQIVDGGHSPSKIIRTFLSKHDRQQFQPYLFVTEAYTLKQAEYPTRCAESAPSTERGAKTLQALSQQGIGIGVIQGTEQYLNSAKLVAQFLKEQQIDIAIFHESDVINLAAAKLSDVPCKAFFMHSNGLKYPGFDLYICGDDQYAAEYPYESKILVVPFALDVRQRWESVPPARQDFGTPAHAKLMTTISNHFEHRASLEFCAVVEQILRQVPDSYYLLIGAFKGCFETWKATRFSKEVSDRILSLGSHPCPSQLLRSMDLYLNEFPEGSGFAVLDAMAAGCPVVSMYDPNGSQARRVGGGFFGVDRAITSLDPSKYAQLAVQLLTDEAIAESWADYTLKRYDSIVHVEKDVRAIEKAAASIASARNHGLGRVC